MARYDADVLEQLAETAKLAASGRFWRPALLSLPATALLYFVGSGPLFVLYLAAFCLWTRDAKLGGLIGWLIAAQTVFLYYGFPEAGHFIEYLLRAPARVGSRVPSTEELRALLPQSFSARLFWSLVFGLRGGGIVGLGLGLLGGKLGGRA